MTQRRRGLLSQVCSDRWAVDRDTEYFPALWCSPGNWGGLWINRSCDQGAIVWNRVISAGRCHDYKPPPLSLSMPFCPRRFSLHRLVTSPAHSQMVTSLPASSFGLPSFFFLQQSPTGLSLQVRLGVWRVQTSSVFVFSQWTGNPCMSRWIAGFCSSLLRLRCGLCKRCPEKLEIISFRALWLVFTFRYQLSESTTHTQRGLLSSPRSASVLFST